MELQKGSAQLGQGGGVVAGDAWGPDQSHPASSIRDPNAAACASRRRREVAEVVRDGSGQRKEAGFEHLAAIEGECAVPAKSGPEWLERREGRVVCEELAAQGHGRGDADREARAQTEGAGAAIEIARGEEAAQRVRAQADRTVVELVSEAQREAEIIRGEADARRNNIFASAFMPITEAARRQTTKGVKEGELGFTLFGPTIGLRGSVKKIQGRHAAVRLLVQLQLWV